MGLSKTKKSLYGVLALALILGFGLAACDGSSPASGGGGNGFTYHTVTFIDNHGTTTAQTLPNVRHGTNLSLAGHIDGIAMPTRAHDDPFTYAWALLGWAEDPDAAATLSCIVVTGDVTLYAVWREAELRFWWGNYIPAYGSEWEEYGMPVVHNDPVVGSIWGTFNLQELIDTREESRLVGALVGRIYFDGGGYADFNAPGAQEGKHASAAVRRTAPDPKSEIFNPTMGFQFFIYPTSFGEVNILDGLGLNNNHNFILSVVDIDGVSYTVASSTATISGNVDLELRFQWN